MARGAVNAGRRASAPGKPLVHDCRPPLPGALVTDDSKRAPADPSAREGSRAADTGGRRTGTAAVDLPARKTATADGLFSETYRATSFSFAAVMFLTGLAALGLSAAVLSACLGAGTVDESAYGAAFALLLVPCALAALLAGRARSVTR